MKPEEHLERARNHIEALKSELPTHIEPFALSRVSKLPFKAESLRQVLTYRVIELSDVALVLLRDDKALCAIIVTRAIIETTAMFYWLLKRLTRVVETRTLEDVDDFMMRMLFGCRDERGPVDALSVLTAIQHLDKDDAFKKDSQWGFGPKPKGPIEYLYGSLSEWAHPNFTGLLSAYTQIDHNRNVVDLAMAGRKGLNTGATGLGVILEVFRECSLQMDKTLPQFSIICEEYSKNEKT